MTNTDKALWHLRIYGPCSNIELARHAGMSGEDTYRATYWLRRRGMVTCGEAGYWLTSKGKKRLEQIEKQGRLFAR